MMYEKENNVYMVDSAVLQIRKSLEAVAFASIAPNKSEYESFRANAAKPSDYRKDFNARAILQHLGRINPDFYPSPLLKPTRNSEGVWHFARKSDGFLTRKQFESFYDRLGKYLHADNPWGNDKVVQNLISDLPGVTESLRNLLEWHFTVIRSPNFNGVWVIQANSLGTPPRVVVGKAEGEFVVQ
jgi:hypothetical protein